MELIGNIVSNARVQELKSGKKVVNFTIAINYKYKNKQNEWKKQTVFYDCSYWNSDAVAPYMTTGKLVQLDGRITGANVWITKQGAAKGNVAFRAQSIQFRGGKPAGEQDHQPGNNGSESTGGDLPF